MKYLEGLNNIFAKYAKETENRFKQNLSWTDNLKNNIFASVQNLNVSFSMPLYAIFIDQGRRPGAKMPPPESLYGWLESKSIPINAAFPIARSIGKKGIEPKPFIVESINLEKLQNDIADLIVENIMKDVEEIG